MERTAFLHASDIFDPRHAGTGIEAPRTENIRDPGRRRQRNPGAGGQGPAGHQGRAPHDLHHAAVALSRVHAAGPRRRRVGAHRGRGRARAAARPRCWPAWKPDENAGYIVRTAAEDAPPEALRADMMYLRKLWEFVRAKGTAHPAGQSGARRSAAAPADTARPAAAGRRPGADRSAERASRNAGVRRDLHARCAAAHRAVRAQGARCSNCTTSRRRSKRRSIARSR